MLPKLNQPTFELTLPSNNQTIEYRPFLVKEEKILLTAKEAGTHEDILRAIRTIINNCVITPGFDVDKLPTFDFEYIFINLRSKSVSNMIDVIVTDSTDEADYTISINLDDVEIKRTEGHDTKFQLTKDVGIIMKYPTPVLSEILRREETIVDLTYKLVEACIDKVYTEEEVYNWADESEEEREEFLGSISVETYEKLKDFFLTMPKLYYETTYTNSKGDEKTVKFQSLDDFFIWD